MQRVVLLRHADRHDYAVPSWATVIEKLGGRPRDPPLSALGHAQAEEVARFLGPFENVEIRCSPYLRCIQTACPLARSLGVSIILDDGLAEVRHAKAHVAPFDERYAYFPEIKQGPEWPDDDGWPVAYLRRVRQFARDLEASLGDEARTVVCVSHAASVAIVAVLLNQELTPDMRFAPAGAYVVTRETPSSPFTLERSGATNAPYVSQNATTTLPWHYAPSRLDEWTAATKARFPKP